MFKPKILALIGSALLFVFLTLHFLKSDRTDEAAESSPMVIAEQIPIEEITAVEIEKASSDTLELESLAEFRIHPVSEDSSLPEEVDRVSSLFKTFGEKLPIVETITYSGRVDWLTGRSAYLGDYASHFQTSKHFIARSLHGTGNYLSEKVSTGDKFNVYRQDKDIEFHFVLDASRLKLWLYYYDRGEDERVLLKSYRICAGKLDPQKASGCLTPLGTFSLCKDFCVYQEGARGLFQGEPQEMISIFGKRWIAFCSEIEGCTGSAKGLGLHGAPWERGIDGTLKENRECIGHYESSGCIRLLSEDIEEIYAIIVSKPSFIHIVKDFACAHLPGKKSA